MSSKIVFLLSFISLPLISSAEAKGDAPLPPIELEMIQTDIKPCDDFYQFACGQWLEKTEIPPDEAVWFRSFMGIEKKNREVLKTILENYSSKKFDPPNPYAEKLGQFYSACMDEVGIEKTALKTYQEESRFIEELRDVKNIPSVVGKLHLMGTNAFFSFSADQDLKNPSQIIGITDQGGLGLPNRDFYLSADPKLAELRKDYQNYIRKMFGLLGWSKQDSDAASKAIIKIETNLAEVSASVTDQRDPSKMYHRIERAGLQKLTPHYDWSVYFETLGYPKTESINVTVPNFFVGLNNLVTSANLDEIKSYLRFRLLDSSALALPKAFVDARYQFVKKLFGTKEVPPRWKRCIDQTNDLMGFALGRSFVEVTFGEEGKRQSKELIEQIERVLKEKIQKLDWMDEPTRTAALKKLSALKNSVGYPDQWRSYDALKVDPNSFLKNRYEAIAFNRRYSFDKLGKPADRMEWLMPPSQVNAAYFPQDNKMLFPAGILQFPFFDQRRPRVANYGAIGMVMGHEMTHGYDDQGRQFDSEGKWRDWWTPIVSERFNKRADCLAKQYDSYVVDGDLHVNGRLTLGEDIGDQGGVKLAFHAWKKLGDKQPAYGGYSGEQQFFIAMAQAWCTKSTKEFERYQTLNDPHPVSRFRVNGSLVNFPEFAQAFQCKEGDKMAPKDKCVVW